MPSLWEIKIYSCANYYWSTLHTSSYIENMDNLVNYSIYPMIASKFFFSNWRVLRDNFNYAIIAWNQIHSCAKNYWSTLHSSSCIENMDNLVNYSIWTLSHDCIKGFFFKLKSQEITSSMPSLCEIKIYSCANVN